MTEVVAGSFVSTNTSALATESCSLGSDLEESRVRRELSGGFVETVVISEGSILDVCIEVGLENTTLKLYLNLFSILNEDKFLRRQ